MSIEFDEAEETNLKSIGDQFRSARERKNWTIEAAAKETKIKVDRLLDLEENDFNNFASPAYARGFVRIYAKYLGLNAKRIMAQLDGKLDEDNISPFIAAPSVDYVPERIVANPQVKGSSFGLKVIVGVVLAFLLLAGLLVYNALQAARPADDVATTNSPSASPTSSLITQPPAARPLDARGIPAAIAADGEAPAVPAATAALRKNTLILRATSETWLRVTAQDGQTKRIVFEDLLPTGSEQAFTAEHFTVQVAVPAYVSINFNGRDYGPWSSHRTPQTFQLPNERIGLQQ